MSDQPPYGWGPVAPGEPGGPEGQPQQGQPPWGAPPQGPPQWGQPNQPEPTQVFGQPPYATGPGQPPYAGGPAKPWQQGGGYGGEPPNKSSKGLIIGGIVAALLLLGGGIAVFALTSGDDKQDPASPSVAQSTDPTESTNSADESHYCSVMDEFEKQFTGMTTMTDTDVETFVRTLSEVEPIAPADIHDEVMHVRDAFAALQSTLSDIGLTFADIQNSEKLRSLSAEDQQKLVAVSSQLTDPTFQTDANAIDQDWATRC